MRLFVFIVASLPLALAAHANDPAPARVTYANNVAEILNARCVRCHRPGEVAPMSLMSYAEVRPWLKAIEKRVVEEHSMPPWYADPAHGTFSNDARLSEAELATLQDWIRSGAPMGDAKAIPPPPTFSDGWVLGEPDYVVELPAIDVPAEGEDQFPNLSAKLDLPDDIWIRAIEVQPSQKRAVHHIFAYVSDDGKRIGGKIGNYSAGGGPVVFPEGSGRRVAKDDYIMASLHYHPFGEASTDRTRIGLYYANSDIKEESVALAVMNTQFKIPAGAKNYEVTASHTFDRDARVTTLGPHMHRRGTDFTISAVFPDGTAETLLTTHWNPDWNLKYELAEPLVAPKGTRLDMVAHFDNSADNPNNPDPSKDLTFGTDEMMIGFIDYLVEIDK